jgi:hypothetical protein
MNELMVAALRCDLTRVITFMAAHGASGRSHDFLGYPGSHHQLSHHQGQESNLEALRHIARWEVEQFVHLIGLMAAAPDGEGTSLLDNTMVYFSSEIEDGNAHRHWNLPVLLAGGAGLGLTPGQHHVYEGDPPMANLFMGMLEVFGTPVSSFGQDGTEVLPGLFG